MDCLKSTVDEVDEKDKAELGEDIKCPRKIIRKGLMGLNILKISSNKWAFTLRF